MYHISDTQIQPTMDIRSRLLARVNKAPAEVWTPSDFSDLGSRHCRQVIVDALCDIGADAVLRGFCDSL